MMELYPGLTPASIKAIPSMQRFRLFKGKEEIEKKKEAAQKAAMSQNRRRR